MEEGKEKRRVNATLKAAVVLVVISLLATSVAAGFFKDFANAWKYVGQQIIKYLTEWAAKTVPYVLSPGIVLMQINPCVYTTGGPCPAYNIDIFYVTLQFAMTRDPGIARINAQLMSMLHIWYLAAITIIGAYIIFMAGSPQGRSNAKDTFVRLIVGMVLVSQSPILFQMMLDIERQIVDTLMATASGTFASAMRHMTFFISAKYCCSMWILILVSALAAVLGALRYFLVYIMACFFPLTLFMYFTDIPNPFFSLRGLGTRLFKFTIMLFIIQILQVLMLATGLIIAGTGNPATMSVTERLLHFLLMTAAFGSILLTPMIGMQLMSWIGAVIHITSTRPSSALSRFVATWMRTGNIGTSLETASGQYMIGHSMGDHVGGEATGPSTGFRYAVPNAPIGSFGSGPEMEFPHIGPTAPAGATPSGSDFGPGLMAATGVTGGLSLMQGGSGAAGTADGGSAIGGHASGFTGGFSGGARRMPARRAGASAGGAAGGGRTTSSSLSKTSTPGGSITTQLPGSKTSTGGVGGGGAGGQPGGGPGGESTTGSEVSGEYSGGTAYTQTRPGESKTTQGATNASPGDAIPGKGEMVIEPQKQEPTTPTPAAGWRIREESVDGKTLNPTPSAIKSSMIKPIVDKKPEVTAGLPIGDQVDDKMRMSAQAAPKQPAMSDIDKSKAVHEAKRFNEDMASNQKSLNDANGEWRRWERKKDDANKKADRQADDAGRKADRDAAKYALKQERNAKKFAEAEELKVKNWAASYLRNMRGYSPTQAQRIVEKGGDISNPVLADPKLGVPAMADSVDRASEKSKSVGRGGMSPEDKTEVMGRYMGNAGKYRNLEVYGSTRGEAGRGQGKPTGAGKANAKRFRDFIDGKLDPAGEGKAPADPVKALDNIMGCQDEYWSSADKLMDNAVLGNLAADQYLDREARRQQMRPQPTDKPVGKPRPGEQPTHTPEELLRRELSHQKKLDDEGRRLKKETEEHATEQKKERDELLKKSLEQASFESATEKAQVSDDERRDNEKLQEQEKESDDKEGDGGRTESGDDTGEEG